MRVRYNPAARPELAAWPFFIDDPKAQAGRWADVFADPHKPFRVELGCCKGGFLAQLAAREDGFNYLGIDIKSEVLLKAKHNIEATYAAQNRPIDNVVITAQNIELFSRLFSPAEMIQRIYLNFPNPCHKSGYAKHRLTHPRQLIQYRQQMPVGGEIHFKTDDDLLYRKTLSYLPLTGFDVVWQTDNLHENEPEDNIRTEHETMFLEQGLTIKRIVARKNDTILKTEDFSTLKNI